MALFEQPYVTLSPEELTQSFSNRAEAHKVDIFGTVRNAPSNLSSVSAL